MPQFDPYGAEQMTVGQTLGDFATSPIRPSTYMSMYATWPGMWSTSKGLWIPGIGKSLETRGALGTASRAMRMTTAAFRRKGIIGGTAAIGGETFKRLTSFGTRGGGFLGESFLNQPNNVAKIQQRMASQQLKNELYKSNLQKIDDYLLSAKNYTGKSKTALRTLAGARTNIGAEKAVWTKMLNQGNRNLGRYSNLLSKAGSAKGLRTGAKIGLGAGKVVSMVGAAMFAWDMIKMVGEPLGRAAIRTLDNTLTEYNNRFMPETGGRLELSYLSQGAATERQRAIQAISKSYINGRSAFGSEASYMHQ